MLAEEMKSTDFVTYAEAAEILGHPVQTLRTLVFRGILHVVEDPRDRRKRLLSRTEVERYATRVQRHPISAPPSPRPVVPVPTAGAALDMTPQKLAAIGGGVLFLIALLYLFKGGVSPLEQALIIGAMVGVALLLLAEWQEQGRITAEQRRHLETLAKIAETDPEPFMRELEQVLSLNAA